MEMLKQEEPLAIIKSNSNTKENVKEWNVARVKPGIIPKASYLPRKELGKSSSICPNSLQISKHLYIFKDSLRWEN